MADRQIRVYHHYADCEEFYPDGGMWRVANGPEAKRFALAAERLMADPDRFQAAMERVLIEWPKSCEAALSAESNNQRAWLGHAGCFLAVGSPEECTRAGWHLLDEAEQYAANAAADRVIAQWRGSRRQTIGQLDLFTIGGESA